MNQVDYEKSSKQAVDYYFSEHYVREAEDFLLHTLKLRQEVTPSEKNSEEWLSFTDWVLTRRGKQNE